MIHVKLHLLRCDEELKDHGLIQKGSADYCGWQSTSPEGVPCLRYTYSLFSFLEEKWGQKSPLESLRVGADFGTDRGVREMDH